MKKIVKIGQAASIQHSSLIAFISIGILIVTLSSFAQWASIPLGGTLIWWAIEIAILIGFLKIKTKYHNVTKQESLFVITLFVLWNIGCIVRGFLIADNYWEFKNLINTSLVLLLPLSIYSFVNVEITNNIARIWVKFALPFFIIFLPFMTAGDAYGRYLAPLCFFLLFFSFLNTKWKIVIVLFSAFVILGAMNARSSVIKFSIAFLLGLTFYFRTFLSVNFFRIVRFFLLFCPFVFFFLGATGKFNVFKMDEYLTADLTTTVSNNGQAEVEDLRADTRSGLYEEVLASARKHNYVLAGRTPARGNDSELFGEFLEKDLKTGKRERFTNEVSILNIFTWTGVIGVFLYFFIFYKATYLAINKSNSLIMRIIGTFVAFRWTYAWIEDFSDFDLTYIYLWIMIGICFSKSFRKLTDKEFKDWTLKIFSSKRVIQN